MSWFDIAAFLTAHKEKLFFVEGALYMLGSIIIIVAYFWKKSLRQPPGNVICLMAISEGMIGLRWFAQGILSDHLKTESILCQSIGWLGVISAYLFAAFNTSFVLYCYFAIKYSLTPGRIPIKAFIIIPIVYSLAFMSQRFFEGLRIFRDDMGVCILKKPGKSRSITATLAYYPPIVLALFVKLYFRRNANALREDQKGYELLRFQSTYVTLVILSYLALLYWLFPTIMLPNDPDLHLTSRYFSQFIRFLSFTLLFGYRFKDPTFRMAFSSEFRVKAEPKKSKAGDLQKHLLDVEGRANISRGSKGLFNPVVKTVRDKTVEIELPTSNRHETGSQTLFSIKDELKGSLTMNIVSSIWSYFSIHYAYKETMRSTWYNPGLRYSEEYEIEVRESWIDFRSESGEIGELLIGEELLSALPIEKVSIKVYESVHFQRLIKTRLNDGDIIASLDLPQNLDAFKEAGEHSGGKSGEFFFFTSDNKFLLKSISPSDKDQLLHILPSYVSYLKDTPRSLIAPIYGLFEITFPHFSHKISVILLQNINYAIPKSDILAIFDLKGSRINRQAFTQQQITSGQNVKYKSHKVGKDIDFEQLEGHLGIPSQDKEEIINQMRQDAYFLCENNLMDYSLIASKIDEGKFEKENAEHQIEARTKVQLHNSAKVGSENILFTLGIVDYLQEYNASKKLERFYKILRHRDLSRVSVVPPDQYRDRFISELEKIL